MSLWLGVRKQTDFRSIGGVRCAFPLDSNRTHYDTLGRERGFKHPKSLFTIFGLTSPEKPRSQIASWY